MNMDFYWFFKYFWQGIYVEVVDYYGHIYGIGSKELKEVIKEVDREIYHLEEQMISLGLNDVSVMICSDHGMTPIKETLDIEDALDYEEITALIPEGATVKIWPKDGALEKVILYIISQLFLWMLIGENIFQFFARMLVIKYQLAYHCYIGI